MASLGIPERGPKAKAFRFQKELPGGGKSPRVTSVEQILRRSIRISRRRRKEPLHNMKHQIVGNRPRLQNESINRRRYTRRANRIVIQQSVARGNRRSIRAREQRSRRRSIGTRTELRRHIWRRKQRTQQCRGPRACRRDVEEKIEELSKTIQIKSNGSGQDEQPYMTKQLTEKSVEHGVELDFDEELSKLEDAKLVEKPMRRQENRYRNR